jgi:hypothetical protein
MPSALYDYGFIALCDYKYILPCDYKFILLCGYKFILLDIFDLDAGALSPNADPRLAGG